MHEANLAEFISQWFSMQKAWATLSVNWCKSEWRFWSTKYTHLLATKLAGRLELGLSKAQGVKETQKNRL